MENTNKTIKCLLCQLNPKYKDKKATIDRVRKSLEMYQKKDLIDIVLFPEMSFSGYNFKDKNDIQPYSVEIGTGIDFQFCKEIAIRLNCYVGFGYIEKAIKNQNIVFYNSAAIIDRKGQVLINTRKAHLYYCDQLWSEQGQGFKDIQIINTKGKKIKCAIGICMDINPKNFTSGKYQLADFMKQRQSQVLLFLTNWTDNQPKVPDQQSALIPMYNYWLHRLRPLVGQGNRTVLFLAADRVGQEYSFYDKDQCYFFGGSCAIMLNPVSLIKNLNKKTEGYLMIETYLPQ